MNRRLALRTERLTELTPGDLASVNGGQVPLPTDICITEYPTITCSVLIAAVTRIVTTTTG